MTTTPSATCGRSATRWRALTATLAAVVVAAVLLSDTAWAEIEAADLVAVTKEDVDVVLGNIESLATAAGPKGSAAYTAYRREAYRELSRSLAIREAYSRDYLSAVQTYDELKKSNPAAVAPTREEPPISLDVTKISGQIEPRDKVPASQKALEALFVNLRQQIRDALPSESGKEGRMYGGSLARACENLDAVAIVDNREKVICSGLLVDRRHVLTAAHCVCALNGGDGTVVLGETAVSASTGPLQLRRTLAFQSGDIRTPLENPCPTVNGTAVRRGRDIALIALSEAAPAKLACGMSSTASPIAKIAPISAHFDPAVLTVRAAGFGRTESGSSGAKLYAHIGVFSRICGPESVSYRYGCIAGRETLLVDPAGLRDTCGGDSGGPVYIKSGNSFLAYAITSRGLPGSGCGAGGIYSLITPGVVSWMRRNGVDVAAPY
jgi:hypothetical protein